jgi:hypothetical protein
MGGVGRQPRRPFFIERFFMSKFSSWIKKSKVASAVVNFIRAPDRMLKAATQGDLKKAVGFVVNPWTSNQSTRDRWVRRAGGAISGAVGGFVTGGPAGAVVGAGIGAARAKKGKGKLKDYAGSALIGAGVGLAITAAPKIIGAGSKVLTAGKAAVGKVTVGKALATGATAYSMLSGAPETPQQGGDGYYMPPESMGYVPNVITSGVDGYARTQPERKTDNTALYVLGFGIGALILTRS